MAETSNTPEERLAKANVAIVTALARKEQAYEKLAKAQDAIERGKKFAASQGRLSNVTAALEKAEAAKAQFQETVAKFEAAKAKAEAAAAKASGRLAKEIMPVEIAGKKGEVSFFAEDEFAKPNLH